MKPFGWHLRLDLYDCDPTLIRDKKKISKFAVSVTKLIKMRTFGKPWVKKFGASGTISYGATLVQLIETSAIVAHFSESTNSVYLDLFSCKSFDPKMVKDFATRFFRASDSEHQLTERGRKHNYESRDAWKKFYPHGYLRSITAMLHLMKK